MVEYGLMFGLAETMAIIVGVAVAMVELRQIRGQREVELENQRITIENRQIEMFMGVYEAMIDPEILRARTANEIIDMGYYVAERGDAKISVRTSKGENVEAIAKYVLLWKKTPESYKIHWDIFNSNKP